MAESTWYGSPKRVVRARAAKSIDLRIERTLCARVPVKTTVLSLRRADFTSCPKFPEAEKRYDKKVDKYGRLTGSRLASIKALLRETKV